MTTDAIIARSAQRDEAFSATQTGAKSPVTRPL